MIASIGLVIWSLPWVAISMLPLGLLLISRLHLTIVYAGNPVEYIS